MPLRMCDEIDPGEYAYSIFMEGEDIHRRLVRAERTNIRCSNPRHREPEPATYRDILIDTIAFCTACRAIACMEHMRCVYVVSDKKK